MNEITINGEVYTKKQATDKLPMKIVVLQRGWVVVGKYERKDDQCFLHDASVIRIWGTTKGLGELAMSGPTSRTKLDKCQGIVEYEALTKVLSIDIVDESKW